MATPNIGTTVSEGYSNGFARLGRMMPVLIVPALALGAAFGIGAVVTALLGASGTPTFEEVLAGTTGQTFAERAVNNGVSAVIAILTTIFATGVLALITGALRRERQTGVLELPSAGSSVAAAITLARLLMPKVGLLALLASAGTIVSILNQTLGGFVGFVGAVAALYLGTKWIYAPVVCGSGEAEGDAAYARSEAAVSGSWWGTLGVYIVVSLAIALPIVLVGLIGGAIVAGILGVVLGAFGIFAGALVTAFVLSLGLWVIGAAALESAWAQLAPVDEASSQGDGYPQQGYVPPTTPPQPGVLPPQTPPQTPPPADPHAGPFS